jgi:hypothetical protein
MYFMVLRDEGKWYLAVVSGSDKSAEQTLRNVETHYRLVSLWRGIGMHNIADRSLNYNEWHTAGAGDHIGCD